jgi:hypothetical protein
MANLIMIIILFLIVILYIKIFIRRVITIKMDIHQIIQFKTTVKELEELMTKFESQLSRKPKRNIRWQIDFNLYENSTYDIIFFGYLMGVKNG